MHAVEQAPPRLKDKRAEELTTAAIRHPHWLTACGTQRGDAAIHVADKHDIWVRRGEQGNTTALPGRPLMCERVHVDGAHPAAAPCAVDHGGDLLLHVVAQAPAAGHRYHQG